MKVERKTSGLNIEYVVCRVVLPSFYAESLSWKTTYFVINMKSLPEGYFIVTQCKVAGDVLTTIRRLKGDEELDFTVEDYSRAREVMEICGG